MRWTDEELCELITLWPTHSAKEIAVKMGRPRSANQQGETIARQQQVAARRAWPF